MNSTPSPPSPPFSPSFTSSATICWATSLSLLELFPIHPLTIAISLFNLVQLLQTQFLHANLKIILLCESASILVVELNRMAFVTLKFTNDNIFFSGAYSIQALASFALNFRNHLIYVLTVERAIATICFRRYEKWRQPYLGAGAFLIVILFSGWLSFSQKGSPWFPDLSTVIGYLFVIGTDLLQILALYLLLRYNQRRYRNIRRGILPLSQRFQLAENIRTAKQLAPTFIFHTLNICLNDSISFLIFFKFIDDTQLISLCFIFVTIANSVLCMFIEWTVITHHPILKKRAMRQLKRFFRKLLWKHNAIDDVASRATVESTKAADQILDILGHRLVYSSEQNDHFKMLQESWK